MEDGRDVGRIYEDRHSRPELRWFWSITVYVNPNLDIVTSGRTPSLDEAKAQFLRNWQKCQQRPNGDCVSYLNGSFFVRQRSAPHVRHNCSQTKRNRCNCANCKQRPHAYKLS